MRRIVRDSLTWVVAAHCALFSSRAACQSTAPLRGIRHSIAFVGLDARSVSPFGAPAVIGMRWTSSVQFQQRVELRGAAGALMSLPVGFDAICYLRTDNTCWPSPTVAGHLWTL